MAIEEEARVENSGLKAEEGANTPKVDANTANTDANGGNTRQRKKRKWDQPAEAAMSLAISVPGLLPFSCTGSLASMGLPVIYPSIVGAFSSIANSVAAAAQVPSTVSVVQQSAAAIVQKINQDLANKGLLQPAKIQDEVIAREIVINDAEPGVRYKLTKRQTQEEIQLKTGAVVITRGKYKPPNGPSDHEKPLYLHISAGAHLKDTSERIRAVDQAAVLVEEMLKQGRQTQGPCPPLVAQLPSGMMGSPLSAAVFLGFEADSTSNVISQIRGPNDQYINHIMNETGATVVLRGRGLINLEGAEELSQPLHLFISADNPKSLDDARKLAENLMETVRTEFLGSRLSPYSQPAVSYSSQSPLPPYQVSSYVATSVVPGSYGGYCAYTLPQLSTQVPLGGPQIEPGVATTQSNQRVQSSKVYSAVPPPKQLLAGDQMIVKGDSESESSQTTEEHKPDNNAAISVDFASAASVSSVPSTTLSAFPGFTNTASSIAHPSFSGVPTPYGTSVSQQSHVSQSGLALGYGQLVAASYPQASQVHQPYSVNMPVTMTSYSAYSGIYPQATPLQQVALALQRPPPPVSVNPGFVGTDLTSSTRAQKTSGQGRVEKQEKQRRKFQEFPLAAKEPSRGDQQVQAVVGTTKIDECFPAPNLSETKQQTMPLSKAMLPPPPKNMPPSTVIPSSMISALSSKDMQQPLLSNMSPLSVNPAKGRTSPPLKSMLPPPPMPPKIVSSPVGESVAEKGLKLVEYGEDDDDDDSGTVCTTRNETTPYTNGKPFWAL